MKTGISLTLWATATGTEVHFFAGDHQIGTSTSESWEFIWKNLPDGQYHLMAMVKDAQGKELINPQLVDIEVKAAIP